MINLLFRRPSFLSPHHNQGASTSRPERQAVIDAQNNVESGQQLEQSPVFRTRDECVGLGLGQLSTAEPTSSESRQTHVPSVMEQVAVTEGTDIPISIRRLMAEQDQYATESDPGRLRATTSPSKKAQKGKTPHRASSPAKGAVALTNEASGSYSLHRATYQPARMTLINPSANEESHDRQLTSTISRADVRREEPEVVGPIRSGRRRTVARHPFLMPARDRDQEQQLPAAPPATLEWVASQLQMRSQEWSSYELDPVFGARSHAHSARTTGNISIAVPLQDSVPGKASRAANHRSGTEEQLSLMVDDSENLSIETPSPL